MRRREYLAIGGLALVAGCTSSDGGDGSGDGSGDGGGGTSTSSQTNSPTASQDSTDSPTPEPEPAEFELVEIDAPEEVEINEPFTFSITVGNTGQKDDTFVSDVFARTPDTDETHVGTIELDVPAGETSTFESSEGSFPYITKLIYRLHKLDVEFEIQLLTRVLSFGETYRSPNDVLATTHGIDLKDRYSYEDYSGETSTEEASSGNQWAFVNFEAENDSGSSEFLPFDFDIALRTGNQQYDSTFVSKEQGKYEGGEVGPAVVRSGWIAYEIPQDLSVGDLTIEWFESTFTGDYGVRWRQGG